MHALRGVAGAERKTGACRTTSAYKVADIRVLLRTNIV
jgi:hypothetical protein